MKKTIIILGLALVAFTNVTEAKTISFKGLVDYIGGNYIKFARITP
jgi:hypothetical protein